MCIRRVHSKVTQNHKRWIQCSMNNLFEPTTGPEACPLNVKTTKELIGTLLTRLCPNTFLLTLINGTSVFTAVLSYEDF